MCSFARDFSKFSYIVYQQKNRTPAAQICKFLLTFLAKYVIMTVIHRSRRTLMNAVTLYDSGVFLCNGAPCPGNCDRDANSARKKTIAASILAAHNTDTSNDQDVLKIRFDALISHDITYVGIIQTARASGLEKFPVPYALTNCHNSLCAVHR